MTSVTVNICTEKNATPACAILNGDKVGGRFVVMDFGTTVTLILPGVEAGAVNYLRSMAVAIDKTANELEDAIVKETMEVA